MLVSVMKTQSENGSSALIGRSERTSSLWAALINGTASHSQDFDDVHDFLSMHSTVPVCSAAITAAEMVHASGAEFINAVANGIDVYKRQLLLYHLYREQYVHYTAILHTCVPTSIK